MNVTSPPCENNLRPSRLVRWCKFNVVGGIGIAVQFAALFLLKSVLHLNYLTSTAVAVEAAVVHNFVWHEQFTWADRTKSYRRELDRMESGLLEPRWRRSLSRLLSFNLTNGAVSILGNLALMKAMVGRAHMNYLVANAIAITLCSLANFLVSETWVFEREWSTSADMRCKPAVTKSSAQLSHSSFRPAAACKLRPHAPAGKLGRPAESTCPAQSTKKAAATPAP
jgi:putative flippase GtrA